MDKYFYNKHQRYNKTSIRPQNIWPIHPTKTKMAEARTKYSNRIQYNMLNTIHIHTCSSTEQKNYNEY